MSIPSQKLVIGPIDRGLRTDRTPFVIDNDSFPQLINAYQWRGRVKRKRGTSLLTRLRRFFNSTSVSYSSTSTIALAGGAANILTGFGLQSTGNIIPGTVTITDTTTGQVFTEPMTPDGTLIGNMGGSGTIVYSTGAITISGGGADLISVVFSYFPGLPVMGLRDFIKDTDQYPQTIAFDTVYSYKITQTSPYDSYDVSFYKNPSLTIPPYTNYVVKTNPTPVTWNGENYQQFWTINYQGALWASNGVSVPFTKTHIGMQFAPSANIVYIGNTATTLTVTIAGSPLVIGDFVFVNEWTATVTPSNAATLNFQSGYVTQIAPNIIITFPNANIAADTYVPGIIQYLTNRSDTTKDCIRWFDGDPTNGSVSNPILNGHLGWVNFSPPLSQAAYSIANLPPAIYYLVGCKLMLAFKDRLCFFGPVVQTSADGSQIYLQDTVIYSQNGTAYYTASFQGDPRFPTSIIPILVPDNQTAFPAAYFEDSTGFGGFITSGIDEPITTAASNEDALIVGFSTNQTRFVYTGNDIVPFNFYLINSELGSSSTFSSINMDRGVLARGSRGYTISSQTETRRIDLDNPDEVFQERLINNGAERFTAARDFINEWVYFSYPSNENDALKYVFNTQTFQYNYRDESWAIFNECYTTYGLFRKISGYTWRTIGQVYPTWKQWNTPWKSGNSSLLEPKVIAGNQQGFVLERDDGTGEGNSLYIQSISGSTITSPDHCLNNGDFIVISGAIGTISSQINGKIFSVAKVTRTTFDLNPTIGAGTYFGGGVIKRMYVPFIQTKQFPLSWSDARKTRIGVQRYLFTKTADAQITLLIFLSEDPEGPYNIGNLVPGLNVVNSSLIYSTVLYTCPESTNIGLTPANVNLMTPTALSQSQIWHRMNTSLIGDTIQIGFTLSDAQMRDPTFKSQFAEIEFHSMILECYASQMLV